MSPNITRRLVDFITEDSDNSHDQPSRILKKRKLLRDNAEDNTREVYSEDDVHFGLEDELDDYRSSPVQDFYSPRSEAYSQRAFQPGSTPISNGRRLLRTLVLIPISNLTCRMVFVWNSRESGHGNPSCYCD